jgi:hypothetical protein
MSSNEKAARSASAAIVFFTAFSGVTAVAAALLPFLLNA